MRPIQISKIGKVFEFPAGTGQASFSLTTQPIPNPQFERITVDPEILAGKSVICGTRLADELVLEQLAAGQSSPGGQPRPTLRKFSERLSDLATA